MKWAAWNGRLLLIAGQHNDEVLLWLVESISFLSLIGWLNTILNGCSVSNCWKFKPQKIFL
jgi:hypothetical protein